MPEVQEVDRKQFNPDARSTGSRQEVVPSSPYARTTGSRVDITVKLQYVDKKQARPYISQVT